MNSGEKLYTLDEQVYYNGKRKTKHHLRHGAAEKHMSTSSYLFLYAMLIFQMRQLDDSSGKCIFVHYST